jgi:pyruvate dehydrogenase E1 component alpha subunit
VEGLTYRLDPHIWWDDAAYQPSQEIEQWRASDPVVRTRERLLATGASVAEVEATERDAQEVVADAFAEVAEARDAGWPTASLHR